MTHSAPTPEVDTPAPPVASPAGAADRPKERVRHRSALRHGFRWRRHGLPSESVIHRAAAGIGLGLLIGTTLGLSETPVIREFIIALVASALGYLGLKSRESGTHLGGRDTHGAIASFGVSCVAGIIAGMYVRVVDPLMSIGVRKRFKDWQEAASMDPKEAGKLVAIEYAGRFMKAQPQVTPGLTAPAGSGSSSANSSASPEERASHLRSPTLVSSIQKAVGLCEWWRSVPSRNNLQWSELQSQALSSNEATIGTILHVMQNSDLQDDRKTEGAVRIVKAFCGEN